MLNALNAGNVGAPVLFLHAQGASPIAAFSGMPMTANVKRTRQASCFRFMIMVSKL